MTKKVLLAGIVITTIITLIYAEKSGLTIKGSDTMVILSQRWAEEYMKKYPEASIQVTGGGSGTGFAALINGTTDICNASRPIKSKELVKIKDKFGKTPVEIKSAVDGIAIYIHEANKITEISLSQIKGIYTGTITNWKEIGGPDNKIIVYGRENSSGTYEFLKEHVLQNEDFAPSVQTLPGTAAVVNAISKDVNGIGYGGAAYLKGIKFLKVKNDTSATAYEPTEENIKSNLYPISRYLYMYTLKRPEGLSKSFIDWILTSEGQKIVSEVGYFPLPRK